jgi:hypothetical protein
MLDWSEEPMFVSWKRRPDSERVRAETRRRDASYDLALAGAVAAVMFMLWILHAITRSVTR